MGTELFLYLYHSWHFQELYDGGDNMRRDVWQVHSSLRTHMDVNVTTMLCHSVSALHVSLTCSKCLVNYWLYHYIHEKPPFWMVAFSSHLNLLLFPPPSFVILSLFRHEYIRPTFDIRTAFCECRHITTNVAVVDQDSTRGTITH